MCLLFKDSFDKKVLLESKHAEINEVLCILLCRNFLLSRNSVYIVSHSVGHSDEMFNRNIFTPFYFKFQTSAHAQLVITC